MEETSTDKERKIDRFDKYVIFKGLNDNKVTTDLGISVGTLGKSRKNNRDLSDRNIELILNYYADLSRVWLLTGEGEMLKNTSQIEITNHTKDSDIVSMPSDVWAVISSQAESLKSKDRQIDIALAQTSEMLELLKEQLKKGLNATTRLRAANLVVEQDE